jgi:hypothetical protein
VAGLVKDEKQLVEKVIDARVAESHGHPFFLGAHFKRQRFFLRFVRPLRRDLGGVEGYARAAELHCRAS